MTSGRAPEAVPIVLTQTLVLSDTDRPYLWPGTYVWRGPSTDPVFALRNVRNLVAENVRVEVEKPCEAVCVIERTKTGAGVIPSTMNRFSRWIIQGNGGLAKMGFWCRPTVDENNEHMEFHGCQISAVDYPFVFAGQQSKHHRLAHNTIERYDIAVSADTAFRWEGGTIAVGGVAFDLTRAGDPVTIDSVGVEATERLIRTSGVTTAAQPVTFTGVRYEADQLATDNEAVVIRHAGPVILVGCRLGGGRQRIPRIALRGYGFQTLDLRGVHFGSYGAHRVPPVLAQNPAEAFVSHDGLVFQRDQGDQQNTQPYVEGYQITVKG